MKCEHCGKREANIKYSENINGKKQELNLCYVCAEKLGVIDLSDSFAPMFTSMFSMPELFEEIKCEKCGYTLDDYKKTGLFGCDNCYNTFEDSIDNLLLKIHGKNRHIKRIDTTLKNEKNSKDNNGEDNTVQGLRAKLEKLVKEEKYEEAAVVRDQIKKLEGK